MNLLNKIINILMIIVLTVILFYFINVILNTPEPKPVQPDTYFQLECEVQGDDSDGYICTYSRG